MLPKLTVVISPLISLMKDQVDALTARGLPATFVNSTLTSSQVSDRLARAIRGDVKLLYVAPERFDFGTHRRAVARCRRVAARRRRSALHQRVGPRLPSELSAHRDRCAKSSAGRRRLRSRRRRRRTCARTSSRSSSSSRRRRSSRASTATNLSYHVLPTRNDADKDDALVHLLRDDRRPRRRLRVDAEGRRADRGAARARAHPRRRVSRRARRRIAVARCRTRS